MAAQCDKLSPTTQKRVISDVTEDLSATPSKKREVTSSNMPEGATKADQQDLAGTPSKAREFTMGADAFDCPLCNAPMTGRIFQCAAGHHLCEDCLDRARGDCADCPTCQRPYPEEGIRCLAVECFAALCSFPCKYGCSFIGKPSELKVHMGDCALKPIACIIQGCKHRCAAASMPEHLTSTHKDIVAVLREKGGAEMKILQGGERGVHDNSTWWADASWKPCLLQSSAGWLCVVDRCVEDEIFSAKICHFDKQLRYTFTLRDEQGQALTFTGLTAGLTKNVDDDQIIVCRRQGDKFLSLDEQHHTFNLPGYIRVSQPESSA